MRPNSKSFRHLIIIVGVAGSALIASACSFFLDTELPEIRQDAGPSDVASDDLSSDDVHGLGDTERDEPDAATEDEDADADTAVYVCHSRVVTVCDSETTDCSEDYACLRTQHCLDGECVDGMPTGYGDDCGASGSCDESSLTCVDSICLSRSQLGDEEEECLDARECVDGLLCTRRGYCRTGESGSVCMEDDDCLTSDGFACCDRQTCEDGGTGSYCDDGDFPCLADYDSCIGSVCTTRLVGDHCDSDEQCPPDLYCSENDAIFVCRAGADGDPCDENEDCDGSLICDGECR